VNKLRRNEVVHGKVHLSYLDNHAAGPVIVALHGLAGTGDEYIATADVVGSPFRFVLPDLRGHGASTRWPEDLSRGAFVEDVGTLIRHVSPEQPVTLVGQSMGGHTAILVAAALPELVERLVVLEATVAGGTDPARLGNWFRSWPLPFASPSDALEFLGDSAMARSWTGHLEPGKDGGLVPPFEADVMQAIMQGVAEPQWERWRTLAAPTTAVFAADSMFSADEQAEFVAARPGTQYVTLSSGSHDAHLDATAEWAEVLRSALADHGTAAT
jgi:pimeloyl-ACP methyl ester carboxylesterase